MKSNEKLKIKLDKKKILLILIAIAIVLILFGIGKLISSLSKEKVMGNYANMGLAVEKDGVIYYNKYEQGIVKVKGGKEYQITDETAYSMNVVGDTIYYLTVSDLNTIDIKSVETNGDNLKKIKTIYTTISKIYVQDGYIYYSTNKDGNGIMKLNIETEQEEKIVKANIQDFVVQDDLIYYTDNVNSLSSVTTTGIDYKLIAGEHKIKKIQILKKWIYFYDETENALCKIKIDGSKKKVVSGLVNNEIYNVTSKKIYYFDEVNSQICSSDLRGKSSRSIISISASKPKINIVKDFLYYLDDSKDDTQIYQMYRVKTDGSKTKTIDY